MEKVICFGAGGGAIRLKEKISKEYEIIGYTDNDSNRWGNFIDGIEVLPPCDLLELTYDYIIITSVPGLEPIKRQLLELGVSKGKILTKYVELPIESRKTFLKSLSKMGVYYPQDAACAEAGVFEGEFAKYINEYFPNRKLHLFDTFEGFDQRDIDNEKTKNNRKIEGVYNNTSVELVMSKMLYPHNVYVHKGYFPDTVYGGGDTGSVLFCES